VITSDQQEIDKLFADTTVSDTLDVDSDVDAMDEDYHTAAARARHVKSARLLTVSSSSADTSASSMITYDIKNLSLTHTERYHDV
jgi:hypothetical protein